MDMELMEKRGTFRRTSSGVTIFVPELQRTIKRYDDRSVDEVINSGDRDPKDIESYDFGCGKIRKLPRMQYK